MCGGTVGETLGLNTEQAGKFYKEKVVPTAADIGNIATGGIIPAHAFEQGLTAVENLPRDLQNTAERPYESFSLKKGEGVIGQFLERNKLFPNNEWMNGGGGDYGTPSDTSTTDTTDNKATETTMTAEEKRNKIRQLMASRYGRSKTILTGGTGVSDFGV